MIKEICKKRNLITFIGIVFSIIGITFCNYRQTYYAAIMLVFAGICDAFDGAFAKKINDNSTEYGVQLDSFADIISSGVLPVLICMSLGYLNLINIFIYILFIMCGIIRLTYYNVHSSKSKNFTGIPITSSTIVIPLLILFTKNEVAHMVALTLLSFGFVSNFNIKKPSLLVKIIFSIIGILICGYVILREYFNI